MINPPDPNYEDLEGTEFEKELVTNYLDNVLGELVSNTVFICTPVAAFLAIELFLGPLGWAWDSIVYVVMVFVPMLYTVYMKYQRR